MGNKTKAYFFLLPDLEGPVHLVDKIDDERIEDAFSDGHFDAVRTFHQLRRLLTLRKQDLVKLVVTTPFALHQFEVVEDPGQALIASDRDVQDIPGRHPQRQKSRIDDLQPVRKKIRLTWSDPARGSVPLEPFVRR